MIRKTVQFALLFYDGFTGKCITQGGHVFTLNGRTFAPIRKPEGYYVFIEPFASPAELVISGGAYETCTLKIDPSTLDPAFPLICTRLMRKNNLFSDCEYLEGRVPAGCMVYALKQGGGNRITAIRKNEKQPAIAFSGYFPQPVTGIRFMIGTEENREIVITGEYLPDKSYRLEMQPKHSHKSGEPAVRVYAARSDSSGRVAIPVEKGQKALIHEILVSRNGGTTWDCLSATELR